MSSYKDYKKNALENPEVRAEYDALQAEYDIIQVMINARYEQNLTQKKLSERTGITQTDISRIENASRNPSPSKVLSHGALIAAALARPSSRRKMESLREFSSRQARAHRELWWRAIERALELPEEELPPVHPPLAPGELSQPRSW